MAGELAISLGKQCSKDGKSGAEQALWGSTQCPASSFLNRPQLRNMIGSFTNPASQCGAVCR